MIFLDTCINIAKEDCHEKVVGSSIGLSYVGLFGGRLCFSGKGFGQGGSVYA
jgi:hypothetical protein